MYLVNPNLLNGTQLTQEDLTKLAVVVAKVNLAVAELSQKEGVQVGLTLVSEQGQPRIRVDVSYYEVTMMKI